jgi:hypothetical protein
VRRINRSHLALVGWFALCIGALPTDACSLAGAQIFKPEASKFVEHSTGGKPVSLPAPILRAVDITRGTSDSDEDCGDAGMVAMSVRLPESSPFSISEVGFQFRVVSGTEPDEIFPAGLPLVGPVTSGTMEIVLPWLDGHPRSQRPLDLRVEVVAIAHNGSVGPPAEFAVRAPVGAVK